MSAPSHPRPLYRPGAYQRPPCLEPDDEIFLWVTLLECTASEELNAWEVQFLGGMILWLSAKGPRFVPTERQMRALMRLVAKCRASAAHKAADDAPAAAARQVTWKDRGPLLAEPPAEGLGLG